MPSHITVKLLQKFCDDARFSVAEPFSQGEYTYACDGQIAIRVPQIDEAKTGFGLTMFDVFQPIDKVQKWVPMAEMIESLHYEICTKCRGTGLLTEKCGNCEGSGRCTCERCDADHDCGTCRGKGISVTDEGIHCDACDGRETVCVPIWENCHIGGVFLAAHQKHLALLKLLTGVQLSESPTVRIMPFKFDGGDGVLSLRQIEAREIRRNADEVAG